MGADLFDTVDEFAQFENEIDDILGFSVRQLCTENPDNRLNQTQYTQPCLFVVNALTHFLTKREDRHADYLAGHSLGEYNALLAAGSFDFLTGVALVKKRGELMAKANGGAMAAVVGLHAATINRVIADNGLDAIDVANFNAPLQTVVSGKADDIRRARPIFEQAGATAYVPLPVSAAFHSRYMDDAASEFEAFLASLDAEITAPRIPVISNVTARAYPREGGSDGAAIKGLLVRQITSSVQWHQTIRNLMAYGVSNFDEVGPGQILSGLMRHIADDPALGREPVLDGTAQKRAMAQAPQHTLAG